MCHHDSRSSLASLAPGRIVIQYGSTETWGSRGIALVAKMSLPLTLPSLGFRMPVDTLGGYLEAM